jgi:tRNA threonylcarbamoyladenosine biosynthesis protein TsaE
MKVVSTSLEQTEKIAQDFVKGLTLHAGAQAFVVGLHGDLGSGKTTFTQAVARALGITEDITSPTYVIEKIYPVKYPSTTDTGAAGFNRVNDIKHDTFEHLVHVDAYRLESGDELLVLDWQKTLSNPKNLILLEWPEKVESALPKDYTHVNFRFISENEREVEI